MEAVADRPAVAAPEAEALPTSDKVTIGMIVFFMLVAVTLEGYWLIFHNHMDERNDLFVKLLALYWPADRTYHVAGWDVAKSFTLSLESINTVVTQWFNAWLIWAILKRKHYRHALQLTISTYTAYGTVLYYYVAHLNGYTNMEHHTTGAFLMFYIANLPWLVGYGWMAYESIRAIARRFRTA
jgi:hypothetical protein